MDSTIDCAGSKSLPSFFALDFCGTVIRGSAGTALVEELIDQGLFGAEDRYSKLKAALHGGAPYREAVKGLQRVYCEGVKGNDREAVQVAGIEVARRYVVRPGFRRFYHWCCQREIHLAIATASPVESIVPFLQEYPVDSVLAFEAEHEEGTFTGQMVEEVTSEEKRRFVEGLKRKHGGPAVGVGDSSDDLAGFSPLDRFILVPSDVGDVEEGDANLIVSDFESVLQHAPYLNQT